MEGSDKTQEPIVALFTVKELNLAEINKYLRDTGVASIAKIRDIRIIDEIPLLGNGKTNYRALKAIIEEGITEG